MAANFTENDFKIMKSDTEEGKKNFKNFLTNSFQ